MGLRPDDYRLQEDDNVKMIDGKLIVERTVLLNLCRCRECSDSCERLSPFGYVLCTICNNNHSQKEDPHNFSSPWLGPHVGDLL